LYFLSNDTYLILEKSLNLLLLPILGPHIKKIRKEKNTKKIEKIFEENKKNISVKRIYT
jgi:hypothetical protein